jgi:carboxyl-terminal processing protease
MNWVRTLASALGSALLILNGACKDVPAKSAETERAPLALETFDTVWEKINEHHFDTNYNGHDWVKVRAKYRPRAAAVHDTKELRNVLQEMIDLLKVSHMAIVPGELSELIESKNQKKNASLEEAAEEDSGTVGLEVRFIGRDLVVTYVDRKLPADNAGVKRGWILKRIGTNATENLFPTNVAKLDEQRLKFLAWRAAARKLSGEPGSTVDLVFADAQNQGHVIRLKRERAQGEAVQFGSLPVIYTHFSSHELTPDKTKIGLIRFDIWMLPTALAFNKAIDQFRDADGIIIDLRGNIGGMVGMIIGTAGHFLKEPVNLGAMMARDNTFQLPANPRFVGASGQPVTPYEGPVAVLVDEITASASEVFTGAMQELGRVRVFGRRSSGQALPAMLDELPNGDAFYHPISDFVTGKGTRFEGRGVVPDEEIPLERAALLAGKDADVERAVKWIQSNGK